MFGYLRQEGMVSSWKNKVCLRNKNRNEYIHRQGQSVNNVKIHDINLTSKKSSKITIKF